MAATREHVASVGQCFSALLEAGFVNREVDEPYSSLRKAAAELEVPYLPLLLAFRDFFDEGRDVSAQDLEELDAWRAQVAGGQ